MSCARLEAEICITGCNVKVYCAYFRDVESFEIKNYTVNCQMCVFYKRLKRENYGSDYVMHVNDTQSDTQGDTQGRMEEMIIRMIKKNSKISTADMAKELGVGIATVKRKIKKMSNVTFVGRGYSGHWEIEN